MTTGCRVNLKDLNAHVIPLIPADKWEDLGLELLDAETGAAELSHVKANNPETHQRCRAMFERWLLGLNVTWNELIAALQKIGLTFLADKVKKTFSSITDMLPVEHTKSEAPNTHMISRADEASAEFGILLSKILEVLLKNKNKSLQLLKSICSTLTIKNDSNISIFSDEELHKIMVCDDINDLFLVKLRNYWRWDDTSVLSIVVSSLNSKKCESLLDQFSKKIDAKIKLIEIYEQCKRENDFPKGFDKMIAIIKRPFRSITKKEYNELKEFIADNCGVESCAISPFIKASYSSVILEWFIPGAAVAYMTEIASFNKQYFIDHGFIYLKLTASVIFDQRDTVNVSKSKTAARLASKKRNVDSSGAAISVIDEVHKLKDVKEHLYIPRKKSEELIFQEPQIQNQQEVKEKLTQLHKNVLQLQEEVKKLLEKMEHEELTQLLENNTSLLQKVKEFTLFIQREEQAERISISDYFNVGSTSIVATNTVEGQEDQPDS